MRRQAFYYSFWGRLKKQSRIAKISELAIITIILGIGAFVVAGIIIERSDIDMPAAPVASPAQSSTYQPTTKTFVTDYFSFEAPNSWRAITKNSTDKTFVYQGYNSYLVEQNFTVQVASSNDPPKASRVQPVTIESGRLDPVGPISDHCNRKTPRVRQPRRLTIEGVQMLCDSDGTIYSVLVGEKGGDGRLELRRPDGSLATYVLIYTDLTAQPLGRDLPAIVSSFRAK